MRKIKLKTHINVKRSFEHCTLNKYPIIEEALSPRIEHYTRMCLSPVIVKPVNIRVGDIVRRNINQLVTSILE